MAGNEREEQRGGDQKGIKLGFWGNIVNMFAASEGAEHLEKEVRDGIEAETRGGTAEDRES